MAKKKRATKKTKRKVVRKRKTAKRKTTRKTAKPVKRAKKKLVKRKKVSSRTLKKPKKKVVRKKTGSLKKHLVKTHGHREQYDERKVYASVYAASLNCHYSHKKSERIAAHVTKEVNSWVRRSGLISSAQIRTHILQVLDDRHVALMYRHHLDLC